MKALVFCFEFDYDRLVGIKKYIILVSISVGWIRAPIFCCGRRRAVANLEPPLQRQTLEVPMLSGKGLRLDVTKLIWKSEQRRFIYKGLVGDKHEPWIDIIKGSLIMDNRKFREIMESGKPVDSCILTESTAFLKNSLTTADMSSEDDFPLGTPLSREDFNQILKYFQQNFIYLVFSDNSKCALALDTSRIPVTWTVTESTVNSTDRETFRRFLKVTISGFETHDNKYLLKRIVDILPVWRKGQLALRFGKLPNLNHAMLARDLGIEI
jgi:hypothetical protein